MDKSYTCPRDEYTKIFTKDHPGNLDLLSEPSLRDYEVITTNLLSVKSPKIGTLNVHSLRKFLSSSEGFSFMKNPLDVLILTGIQSSFCKIVCEPLVQTLLLEYEVAFWNSSEATIERPSYIGTAILCRSRPDSVYFGFLHQARQPFQERLLTVRFPDCSVIGAYCPTLHHKNKEFLRLLNKHVEVEQRTSPTFVLGNIPGLLAASDVADYNPSIRQMVNMEFKRSHGISSQATVGKYAWYSGFRQTTVLQRMEMRLDFALVPQQFDISDITLLSYTRNSKHRSAKMPSERNEICENLNKNMPLDMSDEIAKSLPSDFGTLFTKTDSKTIIIPTSCLNDNGTLTAITRRAIKESLVKIYGSSKQFYGNASTLDARVRLSVGPSCIISASIDIDSTHTLMQLSFAKGTIADFDSRFVPLNMATIVLQLSRSCSFTPVGYIDLVELRFEESTSKYVRTTTTVVLVKGLLDSIILGQDFFARSCIGTGPRAKLNYRKQTLKLGSVHIPWAYYDDGFNNSESSIELPTQGQQRTSYRGPRKSKVRQYPNDVARNDMRL